MRINVQKDRISLQFLQKNAKIEKLIKLGGWIAFFVNDTFVFQEYQSYLEGNCVPGLYAAFSESTFTDYSATALDTDSRVVIWRYHFARCLCIDGR